MRTFTGRNVYPLAFKPEDVDIRDIAHSLSMQCRYNGHSRRFYSVAEHSVLVANEVLVRTRGDLEITLGALLHDAAEAYIGDIVRPLKRQPRFQFIHEVEDDILNTIMASVGLSENMWKYSVVEAVDYEMLGLEGPQLMERGTADWTDFAAPKFHVALKCYGPHEAEKLFLDKFDVLQAMRG